MSKKSNNKMTRRAFVKIGAVSGTTLAASTLIPAAALARSRAKKNKVTAAPPQVPTRVLGKTKARIPILLFGAAVELDPVFDPRLAEAHRFGVNYIDTARGYGTEPAVAAYLGRTKRRDQVWITSKSQDHDPKGLLREFQASLATIKTDRIDLYFAHKLKDASFLNKELAAAVAKEKEAGRMRFFGFSAHDGNVAELLHKAAELPWIDAVMFRYNFHRYGDKALNKAMDAAASAGVGLIAMKTQGAALSFAPRWKKFTKHGKWTQHQAVLKAVWADKRITAAVSHMDTLEKLHQNIGAAVDKTELTEVERAAVEQLARETRSMTCDGCDHLCRAGLEHAIPIGDTLRYLMYHDVYQEPARARALYARLPAHARAIDGVDFGSASARCPAGMDIARHMRRAAEVLA